MQKFRKKPVVITAFQWQGPKVLHALTQWAAQADLDARKRLNRSFAMKHDGLPMPILLPIDFVAPDKLEIKTPEGVMTADLGDWIICGVQGEFYPCKPDIFEATYEEVIG